MYKVTVSNLKGEDITINDTIDITIKANEACDLTSKFSLLDIKASGQLQWNVDRCYLGYYDGSEDPENLAILGSYKYNFESEVLNVDFTILGLTKESPLYDKGRKISSTYTCPSDGALAVKKTFTDRYDTVTGKLLGLDILFDWYRNNGTIGISKYQFKPLSQYEAGELLKKRRDRQINYLIEGAKGTAAEPLVGAIFDHYASQTTEYIATGGTQLYDAIINETDPTINAYLDTVINAPTGVTVRDSILYQIT